MTRREVLTVTAMAGISTVLEAFQSSPRKGTFTLPSNLSATIEKSLAGRRIPGAAVAVVHNDSVVFESGFGIADLEHGAAVTPDTVFELAAAASAAAATRRRSDTHLGDSADRHGPRRRPNPGRAHRRGKATGRAASTPGATVHRAARIAHHRAHLHRQRSHTAVPFSRRTRRPCRALQGVAGTWGGVFLGLGHRGSSSRAFEPLRGLTRV